MEVGLRGDQGEGIAFPCWDSLSPSAVWEEKQPAKPATPSPPYPPWLPDASGSLLERALHRPVLQGDVSTAGSYSTGVQWSLATLQHFARNSCLIPVSFFVWRFWSQHTSFWFRSHADLGTQKINTGSFFLLSLLKFYISIFF